MTDAVQKKIPWDDDFPLDRVKSSESKLAVAGLRDYARMGPGRSLPKLHRKYKRLKKKGLEPATTSLETLKTWSTNHDWVARVERWDALEDIKDQAEWEKRRGELKADEWRISRRLLEKLEELLDVPVVEEVVVEEDGVEDSEDGDVQAIKRVIHKIPTDRWRMSDVVRLFQAASKIGRLASGMSNEHVKHTHETEEGKPLELRVVMEFDQSGYPAPMGQDGKPDE